MSREAAVLATPLRPDRRLRSVGLGRASLSRAADRALRAPEAVKDVVGYALYLAQSGRKHEAAKPLRGFGNAGVLEVVEDNVGGTYRGVYTVRFAGVVYVLHCFQKKSKRGIATPTADLDLVKRRLAIAAEDYRRRTKEKQ